MLYSCEISETCEKRMLKLNYYDIKIVLDGIDFINNFPHCGKSIHPRSDLKSFRIKKFRIYYYITKNNIRIVSFNKNRDYSELIN